MMEILINRVGKSGRGSLQILEYLESYEEWVAQHEGQRLVLCLNAHALIMA